MGTAWQTGRAEGSEAVELRFQSARACDRRARPLKAYVVVVHGCLTLSALSCHTQRKQEHEQTRGSPARAHVIVRMERRHPLPSPSTFYGHSYRPGAVTDRDPS